MGDYNTTILFNNSQNPEHRHRQILSRMCDNRNPIVGGSSIKWYTTLEDNLALFHKAKQILNI